MVYAMSNALVNWFMDALPFPICLKMVRAFCGDVADGGFMLVHVLKESPTSRQKFKTNSL